MSYLGLIKYISIFLVSFNIYSTDICDNNPIYCQIKENKPTIDSTYAMELSNIIYKYTKEYNIPPKIYTAILMQESKYVLNSVSKHVGYIKENPIINFGSNKYIKVYVSSDFGIAQIHVSTIERFDFDVNKLVNDLDYSVRAGAIVLSRFKKRYGKKDVRYWSRYNSSNKEKRIVYELLVERYL